MVASHLEESRIASADDQNEPEYFVDLSDSTRPRQLIPGTSALEAYLADHPDVKPQIYPFVEILSDESIEIPVNRPQPGQKWSKEQMIESYPGFYRSIGIEVTRRSGTKRIALEPESLKHIDMHSWDRDDFTGWAVRFMRANDGIEPTEDAINYLSSNGLGPSASEIDDIFDGDFGEQARKRYEEEKIEQLQSRSKKLEEIRVICDGLGDGKIPAETFHGTVSEDELILRYAKYLVLNYLLTDCSIETKLAICTMRTQTVVERGFNGSIRRVNDAITDGDIESFASFLGVFDDIWPPDTSYMETLKLPEEFTAPRIRKHSALEAYEADDGADC